MKKIQIGCLAIALLAIFTGCYKGATDKEILIESVWIVESIKVHADSVLMKPSYDYWTNLTLSFLKNDPYIFIFNLEVGSIRGKVKVGNKKIDFVEIEEIPTGNSQFSQSCIDLLDNINRYETNGFVLTLIGKKGEEIKLMRKIDF